jgi:hypothetical protein
MRLDKILLRTSVYNTLVNTQTSLNDKHTYTGGYDPDYGDDSDGKLTTSDVVEALIEGSQLSDITASTICSGIEFYDEDADEDDDEDDELLNKYFVINDKFYNILKNTKKRVNAYVYKKRVITYSDIITFLIVKFAHKLRKGTI